MAKRKVLDMSLGNPLHPFRSAARYAFREAAKDLNQYRFMNRGSGDPEIRRVYEAVSDYFTDRGIYPPRWTGLPLDNLSLMGGGTTEGYNLVIQLLIQDVMAENKRLNRALKPAILMPIPTYGFFMHAPESWGIRIVPIERHLQTGGQIKKNELVAAIRKAHAEDLRIVAYFDSNPNNPLGTIRDESVTRELADVFLALNAHYKRIDEEALVEWQKTQPAIDSDLMDGLTFKPGRIWEGPASRVRTIDDMVYDGLEYGARRAFAFAQIPEFYKDAITLAGPSKAGLANMRGGVVIANSNDIGQLERLRINNNYFPSRATLAALEAFYSPKEPFASVRKEHLIRMNHDHRFHGLFMKALINGLPTMPEAAEDDRRRIVETYARIKSCGLQKAEERLSRGIGGIKVITTPEAGFFHLIDFEELRGGTYQSPRHHWEDAKPFTDAYSLIDILTTGQSIHSCNGSWMGMGMDSLLTRATFAIPLKDILEYAERLQRAVGHIRKAERRPVRSRNAQNRSLGL
ncbi:MAG: aminotransferase class I/II-fold pyridoxal phosphate-dependent enzyme [Micavibrio aeruginosavorus]|uniref:Aminotransferase class I/II-fold pyridoxal phosphate-dependent enzyme n=1 Tax=Micavibrio aeruginosavorus TaxID=349221 RepID=A0A7T5UHA5_9BACT|nr:MAG: aminotransferase class I/II-fold pyridoxal phosphate-dependent enzyme [Micavibrio aeruginosavorus]